MFAMLRYGSWIFCLTLKTKNGGFMRKRIIVVAIGLVAIVPVHAGEDTSNAIGQAMNALGQKIKSATADMPDWLKRTDINIEVQEDLKPLWSIETIQPIYQSGQLEHTVFFQGRLAHSDDDETLNLGFGYRHLLSNKTWLLGANTWYDVTHEHNHYRYGLGLEALGQYVDLRTNLYAAQSGEKTVQQTGGNTVTEQALDGWDLSLEAPLPYLPWARVMVKTYEWDNEYSKNLHGEMLSIRMNITDNIEVEAGATDDNTDNAQGFMNLTWHFGKPAGVEHTAFGKGSANMFTARDLTKHTLDKVRRHHDIVVETRTNGGAGITVGRRN
jgi:hypothetical protein